MTGSPAAALTAAVTAAAVLAADRAGLLPGDGARWRRTNHAGRPVSLTEGLALAAGTGAPLLVLDPPAAWAVMEAAVVGALDDQVVQLGGALAADGATGSGTKGLRGHLGALRQGHLTTGVVKIAGLLEAGAVSVAWSDHRTGRGLGWHTVAGAGLVAGGANLANLFDLRPGRALKVALVAAVPAASAGRPAAAAAVGAGLVCLPGDLRGRTMLGDTGANPLGAAVALAGAQVLGPRGRWAALAVVAGLTLASERVSFSRVIDGTGWLRAVDRWGRPG